MFSSPVLKMSCNMEYKSWHTLITSHILVLMPLFEKHDWRRCFSHVLICVSVFPMCLLSSIVNLVSFISPESISLIFSYTIGVADFGGRGFVLGFFLENPLLSYFKSYCHCLFSLPSAYQLPAPQWLIEAQVCPGQPCDISLIDSHLLVSQLTWIHKHNCHEEASYNNIQSFIPVMGSPL